MTEGLTLMLLLKKCPNGMAVTGTMSFHSSIPLQYYGSGLHRIMLPRECEEEMQAGSLFACGTNSGDTRGAAGTNCCIDSALWTALR